MLIKKEQRPILLINLIYLISFSIYFLSIKNYEFLAYVGVVVFFLLLILATNRKVDYSNTLLWGLTIWGFLHMAGGSFRINGDVLYNFILIPLSETYKIFKFDQMVHIFGFGVATILIHDLIKPVLRPEHKKHVVLGIVIVMGGLGIGAVNEIIEFFATVFIPQTNVGGYINTSLDLVSDLIGALIALIIIRTREKKNGRKTKTI